MKKLILSLAALSLATGIAGAIPNPAAVYCTESGYEYENGDCIFPDGSRCKAWQYYCGCEPNGIGCWPGDFNCDFPCSQLPCKQAGEHVLVSECCEGLSAIPPIYIYDDECNYNGMTGWTDICSDCGNGICEVWESRCNCPQDCESSDTNSLILWYKFDETDGNTAADSSCYERHGYVDVDDPCGDPNWGPNDGRYGGCLIFDNDTAVIVPNDVLSDINNGITITVWLKNAYREDDDNWVFDTGAGDFRVQAAVVTEPEREVLWRAGNDTNDVLTWDLDGMDPSWLTEDWRFFGFVKDESAGTMSIYFGPSPIIFRGSRNGCAVATKTGATETLVNVRNTPFKIGALTDHNNDFVGRMDDFRIYDFALPEDDFSWLCPQPPFLECAWAPTPYDGQPDVPPDVVLEWKPGDYADSHDVYFGTDIDEVWDANRMNHPNVDYNNVTELTYDPGLLELGTTYYWRVDEVNEPNVWKCSVWRFTTANYVVVDDFEEYAEGYAVNIDSPWEDGCTNWTGSTLYFRSSPYPVRGGEMSMEYWYDNIFNWGAGFYSEAERKYADPCDLGPRDWIASGVKVLTLYFYGDPNNDVGDTEQMYVGLEDSAGLYAELRYGDNEGQDMNDIKIEAWQRWDMPLTYFSDSDFAAVPNDVNLADVNTLFIGFGIRGGDEEGGEGTVYFDDISLYPPRCVPEFGPYADLSGNCIVDFADIGLMADDWFYVGLSAADLYEDNIVNLRDYAVLANGWLKEQLWPPEE